MDKDTWKKISQIFDIALTLPQERRTTYIQHLCADDPDLQQEIEALLDSIEESDRLLESHLQKNEALLANLAHHFEKDASSPTIEGTFIGNWKVIELLGRGGMGEVYRAERTESDIHQQCALKIMRRGLDTKENVRRFRLEKQILAGLQHPNIASLIEGGVSDDGRPYLVMEYVEGIPIDTYCNQQKLTVKERLSLFETICEAVQHAHKNLIVHRDLKPENILVTDEAHIKILDFGIAKLLDQELGNVSAKETQHFNRVMSLHYAAPEQISGNSITTSTDIYALGILLYELVTGKHPYDFENLHYPEIEEIILHKDPPVPSRQVGALSKSKKTFITKAQKSSEGKLITLLKGDLDAIILKALRKEPEARYQSASRLKEDLIHYLNDKPVAARNGTVSYRIKKFIRRYRWGVAAASITLFSLISGFAIAYWQAQIALQERDQARIEKNKAEEVTQFLTELFEANDPDLVQGDMPTARDLLDTGVKRIDDSFDNNPELRSEMQALLGKLYFIIDEHETATPLLEEGIRLAGANGDVDTQTDALRSLSLLYSKASKYEESLKLLQRAHKLLEQNGLIPGSKHISIINEIRSILTHLNREGEALDLTEEALESARKAYHLSPETLYHYLKAHGTQLRHSMRFNEAKLIFEEAQELNFPSNQAPFKQFEIHESLLYISYYSGDQSTALALHDTLLREADELFPKVHGAQTHLIDIISRSLIRFGRLDEAEQLMREGLNLQKKVYPTQNRYYLGWSHYRLGLLLRDMQQYAESIYQIELASEIFHNLYGGDYHLYIRTMADMGDLYRQMGNYEKSEALISEALKRSGPNTEIFPTSHTIARLAMARLRLEQNRPQDALEYLHNASDSSSQTWKHDDRLQQEMLQTRAQVFSELGKSRQAEDTYAKAVGLGDQISLFRGIAWPQLLTEYARFLTDNSHPEAPTAWERALEANYKLYGDNHPITQRTKNMVASITSN